MKTYRVAVIPGDNIGPEVVAEGLRVLQRVAELGLCRFELETFPWGAGHYLATGRAAPESLVETLRPFHAIYLGAHGDPARVPDRIGSQQLMHPLRKGLDLYVNLRPVRTLPGVPTPLRASDPIDLVVVRENTEGEYSGVGGRVHRGTAHEVALQTTVVTRRGAQRVMRYAFELARRRDRQRYVHCVTKSNALANVMELWDEVFAQVAGEYPDVRTTRSHVDSSSMYLISRPADFDVLVATNLMGDILSDEAAAVCGSIGLAASANLNPEGGVPGMFEPVHGSAPDIAGKGIANPLAAILAGALLLDSLGEQEAARLVEDAVRAALAGGGGRTPDLGGSARTAEVTAAVLAALG
ncbi:MAG TPA: 3-isopropylmalate dehydrogenase [Chloroflexota bacterium]|nr:3-isopropylmalate dehydrogenase [Chloroflexota bacterium]